MSANQYENIEIQRPALPKVIAGTLAVLAAVLGIHLLAHPAANASTVPGAEDYPTDIPGIHVALEAVEDAEYESCMIDAPGTADSKERWVPHCEGVALAAVETEIRFFECMVRVPRSPDAAERWSDYCRHRAELGTG